MNKAIKLRSIVLIGIIFLSGLFFLFQKSSPPESNLVGWIIENESKLTVSYDKNSPVSVPWDLDRDYYLLNDKVKDFAQAKFNKIYRIYIAKKAGEDDEVVVVYDYQYFIMRKNLAADKFKNIPEIYGSSAKFVGELGLW